MESKFQSAGGASDIEVYVYTAQFGAGPSHVGTAVARTHWAGTEIVFLPLAMVKVTGLSANDAAAFLAHQIDGKGGFTDFVRNRHGKEPVAVQTAVGNPIERTTRWGCDYRALSACAAEILDTLESDLQAAEDSYHAQVDQIMHEYANNTADQLRAWTVGGFLTGALTGARVGGWMGALIVGLIGGIGGAVAVITGAAGSADDMQEKLDEVEQEYEDAVCQAKGRAIIALLECIKEHCPDAADEAEQWAEQQIGLEGCSWD